VAERTHTLAAPSLARLLEATMDVVLAVGVEDATVEAVLARADVSRAEFDLRFDSLEDCCIWVFEENAAKFEAIVFGAFESHSRWREGLRAAAYAAARFMVDNPRNVSFGIAAMLRLGPMAQVHRERQLHRMVDMIDAGRQELEDPDSVPRSAAEAVFGSIYALVAKRVSDLGDTASAESFVPELMYVAVRPYLGDEVAREELSIPPPPRPSPTDPSSG
jgi:AcrR family transcriptional regulator